MRVHSFFRSHSNSFDLSPQDKKKALRSLHVRPSTERTVSSASSVSSNDTNSSMPDISHNKRHSLTHNSPRSSSRSIQHYVPAQLKVDIESPPLVFYGTAVASTGALLSGQLRLNIGDEKIAVESFQMKLVIDVKMKKPFHAHCADCTSQVTELTTWNFLQGPATFSRGDHDFPFSCVIPGHLPASMDGALSSIEYVLQGTITPKTGEPIHITKTLTVKRAIQPSETPRQSIRIFPPTNLTSHVELPSVIHPIGEFNVSFRLDGVIKRNFEAKTQTQWKLKRLTWRLDEKQKVLSPACAKHAVKAGAIDGEKKGIAHEETRTLNSEELKGGWKCDYSASGSGSVEFEFAFSCKPDAKPICDTKAEDGTEVSHVLVVEMIVAEEYAPISRPQNATPTGSARVLRMHFNTVLTERGGMGISWDEEQPPLYEDVPASPPGYGRGEVYDGQPIPEYEDLEALIST